MVAFAGLIARASSHHDGRIVAARQDRPVGQALALSDSLWRMAGAATVSRDLPARFRFGVKLMIAKLSSLGAPIRRLRAAQPQRRRMGTVCVNNAQFRLKRGGQEIIEDDLTAVRRPVALEGPSGIVGIGHWRRLGARDVHDPERSGI